MVAHVRYKNSTKYFRAISCEYGALSASYGELKSILLYDHTLIFKIKFTLARFLPCFKNK